MCQILIVFEKTHLIRFAVITEPEIFVNVEPNAFHCEKDVGGNTQTLLLYTYMFQFMQPQFDTTFLWVAQYNDITKGKQS